MTKRTNRFNLHLSTDEKIMLSDLAACMGLNGTQVIRQLIWTEHSRMRAYLADHELAPGAQLRLNTDGSFEHCGRVSWRRMLRNVRGAVVLDDWTDFTLQRLAAQFKVAPEKMIGDLVTLATDGTEFEWRPADHS